MIHDIELVCHLMKRYEVTEVPGAGERVRSNMIDFATCLLRFGEHGHAVVNASRVSQNKERSIIIHTEESNIHADLLNRTLTITKNTDLTLNGEGDGNSYTQDGIVQKIFVPIKEPLRAELISCRSRRHADCSGWRNRNTGNPDLRRSGSAGNKITIDH